MKKIIFILFATFMVTNLCAQVGESCHFNNSKGEIRNGTIYEAEKKINNENKTENTSSYGVQGSIGVKQVVNLGGNYNNSSSSSNSSNTTVTRRGYECCDDNTCTSDYRKGKSIYAEGKKGKYLKPRK